MVKDDVTSDASKGSNTEAMSMTSLAATTTKDGLVSENDNTYYYEKGKQLKNTFKTIDGKMRYFQANGVMAKDYFYQNWGHTYYFQKDCSRLDDGIITGEMPITLVMMAFYKRIEKSLLT